MNVRVLVVCMGWSIGFGVFTGVLAAGALAPQPRRAERERRAVRCRGGSPSLSMRVMRALVRLAVTGVAGMVVLGVLVPFDLFGYAQFLWLTAVVGVPLGSAVAIGVSWRRGLSADAAERACVRRGVAVIGAIGVLAAAVGVWGTFIEPRRLETKRAAVAIDPSRLGDAPVRIAVLSDLQTTHIGAYEHEAVSRLMAEQPDVILLPGDLIQDDEGGFARELPALRALLGRLHAPGGVYLVGGDVDQPVTRLSQMTEGTAVQVLAGEVRTGTVRDRIVRIAGLPLDVWSPASRALLGDFEADVGPDDVRIVLAHRPDVVLLLRPQTRIDLVVAGHTHGGQIALPFIGPPFTMTEVPRAVAAGGLHDLDGRRIFVSTGVGLERGQAPPVRLGVNPTIGIVTLEG